jgi:predicted GH43/DUF377 family glycosyl hydrolase
VRITRYFRNPIVEPGGPDWRRAITFNPAAVYDKASSKFYMLERAAGSLRPMKCVIGLLESMDGFSFRLASDKPVFTPEDTGCPHGTIEDPRVVKLGDTYCMTFAHRAYTVNCSPTGVGVPDYAEIPERTDSGPNLTRSGIAVSKDLRAWKFAGFVTPEGIDDRDNVLFPSKIGDRYALLRRPIAAGEDGYGGLPPSIHISYSADLRAWTEPQLVAKPEFDWEGRRIGPAGPPILTDEGWLTLYHGVDAAGVYRVGVMLLDLNDPSKVVARCPRFIMEPQEYYERFGLVIPNVIFPTANVVKGESIYIYYGCADTCISVATGGLEELLKHVLNCR